MTSHPTVVISNRAKKRLKGKHPWIFSNEIVSKPDVPPGSAIEVRDEAGHSIASGYFNPRTLIAVRILSYHHPFDLRERIKSAYRFRTGHFSEPVYRLIYGESDGLPGLIADRYDETLVLQILTAGMERMRNELVEALIEIVQPARILLRNDSSYRELEGLQLETQWVFGTPISEQIITVDGLKFSVNPEAGQKTGFFLDQRSNRKKLLQYAQGERMLDVFSYSGAWAIYGAKAGIPSVFAVDSSSDALEAAMGNAVLNNLSIQIIQTDAFDYLRKLYAEPERFDTIVLDPPAFCKSPKHLREAMKGYREINLRAMKLLNRGGILFTCSCSQPVSSDLFVDMLRQAAADSGRTFLLRELLLNPADHPVLLHFPESQYLKCAILELQS